MVHNGLTKTEMDLETTVVVIMLTSAQQRLELPAKVQSILAVQISMKMVGQTPLSMSSLVIQHNGLMLMGMVMVTIGVIPIGIKAENRIGLENTSRAQN